MEKIMQNKLTVKIICAALAIILWFYVSYQENPSMTQTVKNIPISLVGEQALKERGLAVYALSDNNLDVIATAKRLTLARLSEGNTSATINVSSIKGAGKHKISAIVTTSLSSDVSFTVKRNNITVTIEPIVAKAYEVVADIALPKEASEKLENYTLSSNKVSVKAPESIMKEIDTVKTENITPSKDSPKQTVKLFAYGKNSKALEGVEFSPSEIEVSFTFFNSKTVPVVLKTTSGQTYNLPDSATVKIFGTEKALSSITCIETEEVNIAHMAVNSSIKPSLKVPKDITLEDMHPGYVEISLQENYFK